MCLHSLKIVYIFQIPWHLIKQSFSKKQINYFNRDFLSMSFGDMNEWYKKDVLSPLLLDHESIIHFQFYDSRMTNQRKAAVWLHSHFKQNSEESKETVEFGQVKLYFS